jgi:hypothetical protein
LGVVHDSAVRFVSPPLVVDEDFAARAGLSTARQRFRFAEPCQEGACEQWLNGRCSVIDEVIAESDATPDATPDAGKSLPSCPIRRTCRWFAQSGPAACHSCRLVITETFEITEVR